MTDRATNIILLIGGLAMFPAAWFFYLNADTRSAAVNAVGGVAIVGFSIRSLLRKP
jgi:hypothetical protein